MRKFAKLALWTLVATVLPAVAFAEDGAGSAPASAPALLSVWRASAAASARA